jgi:hypothetical protein
VWKITEPRRRFGGAGVSEPVLLNATAVIALPRLHIDAPDQLLFLQGSDVLKFECEAGNDRSGFSAMKIGENSSSCPMN